MTELRDDEPVVFVRRSRIDPTVWYCIGFDGTVGDQSDWECPGRLRLVKEHAAESHGCGADVRWERVDRDTYQMRMPGGAR